MCQNRMSDSMKSILDVAELPCARLTVRDRIPSLAPSALFSLRTSRWKVFGIPKASP